MSLSTHRNLKKILLQTTCSSVPSFQRTTPSYTCCDRPVTRTACQLSNLRYLKKTTHKTPSRWFSPRCLCSLCSFLRCVLPTATQPHPHPHPRRTRPMQLVPSVCLVVPVCGSKREAAQQNYPDIKAGRVVLVACIPVAQQDCDARGPVRDGHTSMTMIICIAHSGHRTHAHVRLLLDHPLVHGYALTCL